MKTGKGQPVTLRREKAAKNNKTESDAIILNNRV
jgi:hypothetical protein